MAAVVDLSGSREAASGDRPLLLTVPTQTDSDAACPSYCSSEALWYIAGPEGRSAVPDSTAAKLRRMSRDTDLGPTRHTWGAMGVCQPNSHSSTVAGEL